jgi:hypothetical protein
MNLCTRCFALMGGVMVLVIGVTGCAEETQQRLLSALAVPGPDCGGVDILRAPKAAWPSADDALSGWADASALQALSFIVATSHDSTVAVRPVITPSTERVSSVARWLDGCPPDDAVDTGNDDVVELHVEEAAHAGAAAPDWLDDEPFAGGLVSGSYDRNFCGRGHLLSCELVLPGVQGVVLTR